MTEVLYVPEENLAEVIRVIRAGLVATTGKGISIKTRRQLKKWCDEEEDYLERQCDE